MPFLLPFFLLHLWTLCPEVSCYYFYYLRKYNDNPHKNNNTTNQTSNDTIQCQYSHTSCNSKILRHKKHTHFSDTIGTSYQNPIKEIIKPLLYCKPPSFIKLPVLIPYPFLYRVLMFPGRINQKRHAECLFSSGITMGRLFRFQGSCKK